MKLKFIKEIRRLFEIELDKNLYVSIWSMILILQGIFIYNIERIFSEKYFFDSYRIINAISKNDYSYLDKSYTLTAKIFSIFNFNSLREYNMACYLLFFLFFIWYLYKNYSLKLGDLLFNFTYIFLASVYLIRPGKEFLQFILLAFCYKFEQLSPIFLIIGGVLFRIYLIIQGLIFILIKFYFKRKKKILWLIFFLVVFLVITLRFPKLIEKILVEVRENVNKGRQGSENAKSIINSLIEKDGVWYAYLNYIINTIRLLFPIELIFRNIKYFPYVIFQFWLTKKLWQWRKNILNDKVILLYSFILVSGIFEPDFGSFLRHTVPYLIFILSIMERKKYEK